MSTSRLQERPAQHGFKSRNDQSKSAAHKKPDTVDSTMSKFEKQLDSYANSLNHNFRDAVDEIEARVRADLDDIVKSYDNAFGALAEAEWPLQIGFAKEEVEIEDPKMEGKTINVSLSQRVSGFRKQFEDKAKKMQQLWQEWSDVQYDIVCLAIEIFGKESFEVDPQNTPVDVLKTVDEAHTKHETSLQRDQEALAKLSELQIAVQKLSRKSIEESQQQLSDLETSKQKKAAVISAAMKAMEEM